MSDSEDTNLTSFEARIEAILKQKLKSVDEMFRDSKSDEKFLTGSFKKLTREAGVMVKCLHEMQNLQKAEKPERGKERDRTRGVGDLSHKKGSRVMDKVFGSKRDNAFGGASSRFEKRAGQRKKRESILGVKGEVSDSQHDESKEMGKESDQEISMDRANLKNGKRIKEKNMNQESGNNQKKEDERRKEIEREREVKRRERRQRIEAKAKEEEAGRARREKEKMEKIEKRRLRIEEMERKLKEREEQDKKRKEERRIKKEKRRERKREKEKEIQIQKEKDKELQKEKELERLSKNVETPKKEKEGPPIDPEGEECAKSSEQNISNKKRRHRNSVTSSSKKPNVVNLQPAETPKEGPKLTVRERRKIKELQRRKEQAELKKRNEKKRKAKIKKLLLQRSQRKENKEKIFLSQAVLPSNPEAEEVVTADNQIDSNAKAPISSFRKKPVHKAVTVSAIPEMKIEDFSEKLKLETQKADVSKGIEESQLVNAKGTTLDNFDNIKGLRIDEQPELENYLISEEKIKEKSGEKEKEKGKNVKISQTSLAVQGSENSLPTKVIVEIENTDEKEDIKEEEVNRERTQAIKEVEKRLRSEAVIKKDTKPESIKSLEAVNGKSKENGVSRKSDHEKDPETEKEIKTIKKKQKSVIIESPILSPIKKPKFSPKKFKEDQVPKFNAPFDVDPSPAENLINIFSSTSESDNPLPYEKPSSPRYFYKKFSTHFEKEQEKDQTQESAEQEILTEMRLFNPGINLGIFQGTRAIPHLAEVWVDNVRDQAIELEVERGRILNELKQTDQDRVLEFEETLEGKPWEKTDEMEDYLNLITSDMLEQFEDIEEIEEFVKLGLSRVYRLFYYICIGPIEWTRTIDDDFIEELFVFFDKYRYGFFDLEPRALGVKELLVLERYLSRNLGMFAKWTKYKDKMDLWYYLGVFIGECLKEVGLGKHVDEMDLEDEADERLRDIALRLKWMKQKSVFLEKYLETVKEFFQ